MCGIAGYFGAFEPDRCGRGLLSAMIAAIAHRGPDAQGFHHEPGLGLAHSRLSIIDLASGAQPMSNADGTVWIAFNGEIFNYVELRRDLIAQGRRFRTRSDTEVILHLYETRGLDCVSALNGDFAFAIWDRNRRRLVLARDRMGVRPLFYTHAGGGLHFASEVKVLLRVPGVAAELDPVALDQVFTCGFPLAPRTPFKDIQQLPPAHLLLATPGSVEVRPYWRLEFPDAREDRPVSARQEAGLVEEVQALLLDATRIRLRSDVPVGAYLSGGLDSSLVSALARDLVPDRLHTFSVTFDAAEFDESGPQRDIVAALGTEHDQVLCTPGRIGHDFPAVIAHAECPVLRTGPAPLFALSRLVNESGFKVVLTGEGADEVFGGYDIFKEAKLRRFCARQPGSLRRPSLFRRLYPYLPRLQGQSPAMLAAFFAAGGALDDPLYSHLPRFRTTAGAKAFFSAGLRDRLAGYDALAEIRDALPADFARWHPLSQAQYLETAHLLPGYILSSQGDRMSMAHAVEGRYPFLDHRLVEFAARIPPRLKLRGLREKHILRVAAAPVLPAAIGNRHKQPYRAPDSQCFLGPMAPAYAAALLSRSAIAASGYFDPTAVERLVAKCRRVPSLGARDGMALVGILSTQLWHSAFIAQAQPARPAADNTAVRAIA